MITIITGSILEAKEKFIVHQTNCISTGKAAGLAYHLFRKFTYADCYSNRTEPSTPGTIDIRGNGMDQRYIVNLHGQYLPGNFNNESNTDTELMRQNYFHQALNKLAKIKNLESVAFPYLISCGLAGGNWEWYLGELENFDEYVYQSFGIKVIIYRRPGD